MLYLLNSLPPPGVLQRSCDGGGVGSCENTLPELPLLLLLWQEQHPGPACKLIGQIELSPFSQKSQLLYQIGYYGWSQNPNSYPVTIGVLIHTPTHTPTGWVS